MGIKFANSAWGTLTGAIGTTDLAFSLQTGQGSRFPTLSAGDYFYGTFIDQSNNVEIFKCTARTGDNFTVSSRGVDGTTARSFTVGDRVELRVPAISLNEVLSLATLAGAVYAPGASSSFGAMTLKGAKGGYGGINFKSADGLTNYGSLITNGTTTGWKNAADNAMPISWTNAGDFTAVGNVTGYSDERFKENWRDLAPDYVVRLASVRFGIYDRNDVDMTQVGVSAQSLREILPDAVIEGPDGRLSVAYGNAAMVSCIALAQRLLRLEQRLAMEVA